MTFLLIIIAIIWFLAYLRAPVFVWIAVITALYATVTFSIFVTLSISLSAFAAIVFLWMTYGALLLLFVPPLRRQLVSKHILAVFRKILPAMSSTEQEALNAGSVWWDGELFSGIPNWDRLLTLPVSKLSAEEQAYLDGPVDELCKLIDDWKITYDDQNLPPHVWQFIRDNGFFSLIIPKQYGGLDFSALAHSEIVMRIASRSITTAVTVMVPNSLGPGKLLLHYGTPEQKNHFLPRLASGQDIPCFALTGPEAGSDAGAMPDTGFVCKGKFDGKEIVGIRLNWEKRYITLGPVATLLGLAFKLYDPEHLIGEQEDCGITVALIPTNTPGIDIGRRHVPLNIPFQVGPNFGHDVFIPLDWIIGGVEMAGSGWKMLMECLSDGRGISLPALSAAAGKYTSRYTGAYAAVRNQFKMPIGRFEGVEEALARIAGNTYLMNAARVMTVSALDSGERPAVVSAIVKYHLTERMRQVVNDAMDIQGGSGICLGPRNLMGRLYQAIPISITVEGANILTRSMIIFGQGAIRSHPYVLKEIQATKIADQKQAVQVFDAALFGHIGFVISNFSRSLFLGLTRGVFAYSPGSKVTRRYFQHLTWMSTVFALISDICMVLYGGALKRKEKISARLGDILSHLYLASAVLKQFHDDGQPAEDVPLITWACDECLYTIQQQLKELLQNLPVRPLAWLMTLFIFPTGTPYRRPHDNIGRAAANIVMQPSKARDRLTHGVYVTTDQTQAAGRLEAAFEQNMATMAPEKKIKDAIKAGQLDANKSQQIVASAVEKGIITASEAECVNAARALKREVIMVDSFAPDTFPKAS